MFEKRTVMSSTNYIKKIWRKGDLNYNTPATLYLHEDYIHPCTHEIPSGILSIIAIMIKNSNGGHRNTET